MSSNTIEQKRAHKAHQRFRDLLKALRESGACDWPYQGQFYRVVRNEPMYGIAPSDYTALIKQPRRRGYKVTPVVLDLVGSKFVLQNSTWVPQDKHVLGYIVGVVHGPQNIV